MDYPEMFHGRPVEGWLLRWAPRWFPLILPISQPLAEAVRLTARGRVELVTPGLPRANLFFAKGQGEAQDDEVRILYVGDARPRKGLADFLAAAHLAAQNISGLRLVIVSKQPCTVQSHLPVEFHLHPSHMELADLYRGSRLYVSASWGEGLGYPPLEAMACGVPVVLTDSAGVRDYAKDGVNCLMASPRSPDALARAIVRLLSEPELEARLVANGLLTAKRYDWDAATVHLEELLAAQ
jgi:glycosyltransferase involved in cell wall biosynthesis